VSASIKITGDTKTIDTLSLNNALNGEIAAALYRSAEMIMPDSKRNYVPVDTGALMRSGTVLPPTTDTSGRITVTLGYGEPYARIVHDRPPSIGQGKVKYLEKPFVGHMASAKRILEQHLARAISDIKKSQRVTNPNAWKQYDTSDGPEQGDGDGAS